MKNTSFRYLAISFLVLSLACQKEIDAPDSLLNNIPSFKEITFEASQGEEDTKTILNENGSLSWLPGDEINIFCGNDISGRFISDNTEIAVRTTFTGHFNKDVPVGAEYWAVYPYMSSNSFDGAGITLSVPATQVSSPGTFGPGMFPSVAKSTNTKLAFYNVCGLIKFSLSRGDINQITLTSNGGEAIAGTVKVSFGSDGKPVASAIEGDSEITLRASGCDCFEQGKYYYISVLPVTLSRGFTMSFRTIDGDEGILASNKSTAIKRSVSSKKDNIDSYVSEWKEAPQNSDISETGVYLGILAFNQALYTCPISLLTPETLSTCESFINGLQMKNGTILYYAADQGLTNMQQGDCPKSLNSASLITFTDGLDQGSLMMNPDYSTEDKYLSAVNSRIRNGNVFGMPLSAFSIGIRGSDVQNIEKFRNNLVKLASSENNAFEISDMSELDSRFEDIANSVSVSTEYSHDISLTIPGLPDGTKVRFTFDNVSDASSSNLYIEGTFNLSSRTLSNINYCGLVSRSGSSISGVVDDIFVRFIFQKVRRYDGKELSSDDIKQWQTVQDSSSWQINSEFSATATDLNVGVSRKSTIIYLVLDCSSSLGNQFSTMKNSAINFIHKLYNDSYIETQVQSVKVSPSSLSVEKGNTAKLSVSVYPATALDRSVTWSSDNSGIATVSPDGIVTGVSAGSTYIKARTNDGQHSSSCYVTVYEQPEILLEDSPSSLSGLYLGIMTFNQGLYRYPICRLTQDNVESFCSFIDNNPTRNGSLVYYAVDEAISDIQAPNYPTDLSDAALVTFTDCLDQGSLMKKTYTSNEQYLSAVNQRINGTSVGPSLLTAYSIGIRGNDVEDFSGYTAILQKLASSSANAYEINNVSSLEGNLNKIAQDLSTKITYTYFCNLTVTVPGVGNGTHIRFTFDNVNNAAQSKIYIEGTFNLSTRSLTDIVYYGFSSGAESTVSGTVNGIFVTYTFNGLRKSDGTQLSTTYMKEWLLDSSQSVWQINSEFNNNASAEVTIATQRKSAVIYLVLDYSTSIGPMSSSIKSAAKNFVRELQEKSYDPYAVSSVSLDRTSWTTLPGRTIKLTGTISPSTALDKTVSWSSSNPAVASVNQEGLVISYQAGTAIITVTTQDGGLTATCTVIVKDSLGETVDLGLPSGLKWATFNVGATKPEEYGEYFAWGETEPKIKYDYSTYKWCLGYYNSLTKYNTSSSYGSVDNKTVLDYSDDAAKANWGGSWRMPTLAEWKELIRNCTWTWTESYNGTGIAGQVVTARNGNSIFLPAAGYRRDTVLDRVGSGGYYWSSSLYENTPFFAWYCYFSSYGASDGDDTREYGCPVRPVYCIHPVSVTLDKSELSLYVGASDILTATVLPSNSTNKSISWSSSNESVATVDQDGKVTALGIGKASIIVTTIDGAKTASCKVTVTINVEAVDLGLPSELKWASCNVGADSPEDYGNHFAWGETQPKKSYSWSGYKFELGTNQKGPFSKYVTNSSYGAVDNKTVLDPDDDAAHVNWGEEWRIPTDEEWTELIENCTWTWTKNYKGTGIAGSVVASGNGNSIFLPAAGYWLDANNYNVGSSSYYWSSSLNTDCPSDAWFVYFYSGNAYMRDGTRNGGHSIRPVCHKD